MSEPDAFYDDFWGNPPDETETGDATTDALAESVTGPKSATVDGVTVTQFSPTELIAAARFLAANRAAKKAHRGLRFTKLVPPGA